MPSTVSLLASPSTSAEPTIFYLLWRYRPSHPWHSEEFCSRIEAHKRYFSLVERGLEAYLERRSRTSLSA